MSPIPYHQEVEEADRGNGDHHRKTPGGDPSRDGEIKGLKTQITRQSEHFQALAKENASKRRNVLYMTGIVTLAVGFVIGYLARRRHKPDLGFLPAAEIRQRLLGS